MHAELTSDLERLEASSYADFLARGPAISGPASDEQLIDFLRLQARRVRLENAAESMLAALKAARDHLVDRKSVV